jgi:hypothetical protein
MIQDIIAYLILLVTFGIFIRKILLFFNLAGKKKVDSSKCGGCASGCEMKEMHLMNKVKITKYDQYRLYL